MPAWFVTVARAIPVSWLVAVTVAPETTAPVWSVTRTDRTAETCAAAIWGRQQRHKSERVAVHERSLIDTKISIHCRNGGPGKRTVIAAGSSGKRTSQPTALKGIDLNARALPQNRRAPGQVSRFNRSRPL